MCAGQLKVKLYVNFRRFFFLLTSLLFLACNSKRFQNVSARYNGYFYANQRLNEVYHALEVQYEYDFNEVLKVLPAIDSGIVKGQTNKLDDIFKKSSETIRWWKASDWVDDSYLIIGKVRHLRAQFQYAIETFQYINQTSKDNEIRQAALIELMRTYMDMGDMEQAREVSNYLALEEELTPSNILGYQLLLASYHQRLGNEAEMAGALQEINKVVRNRDQRARINFILGQLAQKKGENQKAITYYNLALKGNPPYALVFHARLNKMALADYREDEIVKAYKRFRKMLKDGKNLEYQDKIFYTIGQMEQRRNNLKDAISNYLLATGVEKPNQSQQGLSFLRLGEIYFDDYENYPLASQYYDSAVAKLPKDKANYDVIEKKQKVLKDLVTQLNTINLQDSLLALAEMNPISLEAYLDRHLREKVQNAKQQEEQPKRATPNAVPFPSNTNTASSGDGNSWYFYNQAATSRGQFEFQRTWGNRPLEDNWRRGDNASAAGTGTSASLTSETQPDKSEPDNVGERAAATNDEFSAEKQKLLDAIPKAAEAKAAAYLKMEEAYFNLGRIYRFGLSRNDLAANSYETLLKRFPETEYRLKTLLALYKLFEKSDPDKAAKYKQQIISEFPDSLTAKTLINPNYLQEKEERNRRLQQKYADAYAQYEVGNYVEADRMIRKALNSFEDVDFLPTVELLSALLKAQTEGLFSYEKALNDFVEKYPEGKVHDYAQRLLDGLKPVREKVSAGKGFDFSEDFQQLHLVAITFDENSNPPDSLKTKVEAFNKNFKQQLSVGDLAFRRKPDIHILFINSFKTKSAAQRYRKELQKALKGRDNKDPIFHNFAISRDNFTFLYENEKIDEYVRFHRKFYQ